MLGCCTFDSIIYLNITLEGKDPVQNKDICLMVHVASNLSHITVLKFMCSHIHTSEVKIRELKVSLKLA